MDSIIFERIDEKNFTLYQNLTKKILKFTQDELKIWTINQKTLVHEMHNSIASESFLWDIIENEFMFNTLIQLRKSMKLILTDFDKEFIKMKVFDHYKNYKVKLSDYYINKKN